MSRLSITLAVLLFAVPALAQPEWSPRHRRIWTPRAHHDGASVIVGRDYRLPSGETASGPVVVIGGSAVIDGHADEDVVVIGGDVRVGPTAAIDGNLVNVGGHSDIDPMAAVRGEVKNVAIDLPRFDTSWLPWTHGWFPAFAAGFTAFRLAVVLALALMLSAVFPSSIARVSSHVADAPGRAALTGLGIQVLLMPALGAVAIALAISVVGLPLLAALPVIVALCIGLSVAGFAGTVAHLGAALRGVPDGRIPRIADVYIGMFAIGALTVVGQLMTFGPAWLSPFGIAVRAIGLCVEYVAWTVGIGAAVAALFERGAGHNLVTAAPTPL